MFRSKVPRGRYDLDNRQVIGNGGMGVVYRVYDSQLNKYVALKTLRELPSIKALQMFRAERQALAALNHPNIVDIQDAGELDEDGIRKPFFVMPLLEGMPLDKIISGANRRLTVDRTVGILCDICKGLQAAHDKGVIHRDLKPGNIFVGEDDSVTIIDFGLARLLETQNSRGGVGTPYYMSPEQVERKPLSPATDIFSLGVVAYEMFCLKRPFEGQSEAEITRAILRAHPSRLSERNPEINQALCQVVHKALAKQPQYRYPSASDFSAKLRMAFRNEPILIFDPSLVQARIKRARDAYDKQDYQLADEILGQVESEGHISHDILALRDLVDQSLRQANICGLLEIARKRFQEADFSRALQKLREILAVDSGNAGALDLQHAIEERQTEAMVSDRLASAHQHIQACAFNSAREDAEAILRLNAGDARAQEVLEKIKLLQEEHNKLCKEKSELYDAARLGWQNGHLGASLRGMERVLELDKRAPELDRSSRYLDLYNQIRLEHEAVSRIHVKAAELVKKGEPREGLRLCEECLRKYPNYPPLQMLKLEIEEQTRLAFSKYLAEITRQLEAEPDLEKRVPILQSAVELYPGEPCFLEAWHLLEGRRKLVNDIIAKARRCEGEAQWDEALEHWETLRTVYPQYPTLNLEIGRASEAQSERLRAEKRRRMIVQITQYLDTNNFESAAQLSKEADAEFPRDSELMELASRVDDKWARAKQVQASLDAARTLCEQNEFDDAVATLERARATDLKNSEVCAALSNVWVAKATKVVDFDLDVAESALRKALQLDPEHALAKSLLVRLQDQKARALADQYASRAQQFREHGELVAAIQQIDEGLAHSPNIVGLGELQAQLKAELAEQQRQNERSRDLADLKIVAEKLKSVLDPQGLFSLYEDVRLIANRYPRDLEFQEVIAEIKLQYSSANAQGALASATDPAPRTVDDPHVNGSSVGQSTYQPGAVVAEPDEDVRESDGTASPSVLTPSEEPSSDLESVDRTVLDVDLNGAGKSDTPGHPALPRTRSSQKSRRPITLVPIAAISLVLVGALVYAIVHRSIRSRAHPQQTRHAPILKPVVPRPRTPGSSQSCTLRGRIRDYRGRPLSGADVSIVDSTGKHMVNSRTDNRGGFRFVELAAGTYAVSVRPVAGYLRGLSQEVLLVTGKQTELSLRFRKGNLMLPSRTSQIPALGRHPSAKPPERAETRSSRLGHPAATLPESSNSPSKTQRPPVFVNPRGVIDFVTKPPTNSVIYVDGVRRGIGPKPVEASLTLANHVLRIEPPPGWQPVERTISVRAMSGTTLTITLRPFNGAFLNINTIPMGASIYLDGDLQKMLTPAKIYVAPGHHILLVSKPGCLPVKDAVEVGPGKVRTFGRQLQCL